jgi:anion-transporting  ArsA/GET3 family ATPase
MSTQIKIVLGTGGVGKTSISAALALGYAQRGLRTLVITIDPSLRLKTTLQLESNGKNQKIPLPSTEFYACLLDSKFVFDQFVTRGMETPEKVEKLLKNRLYQQLSTNLSGSQEFTALEKLLYEYESGEWDRIVLDTPPAGHAIDFLRAPQKLNRLLDERIARWFRSPKEGGTFLGSLLQFGTKNLMKALEILTGNEFMTELSDFFDQIQFWQKKLESRLAKVQKLLISKDTEFLLVTSFDSAKLKEALELLKILRLEGLHLQTVIINRAYPFWFQKAQELKLSSLELPVHYFEQRAQEGVALLKSSRSPLKELKLHEYRYGINKIEDLSQITLTLSSID